MSIGLKKTLSTFYCYVIILGKVLKCTFKR